MKDDDSGTQSKQPCPCCGERLPENGKELCSRCDTLPSQSELEYSSGMPLMKDEEMKPYKDIAILQREMNDQAQEIINRDKEISELKDIISVQKEDLENVRLLAVELRECNKILAKFNLNNAGKIAEWKSEFERVDSEKDDLLKLVEDLREEPR